MEEPTIIGSRLDVGGFIFADPFDTVLREVSIDYLESAWLRLCAIIDLHRLKMDDLSWGVMHPGNTYIADMRPDAPSDYIGWTSRKLWDFDKDPRFGKMDKELMQEMPRMRVAVTWRSHKWRISPTDYGLAICLFEAIATDEIAFWSPDYVLESGNNESEVWVQAAQAIQDKDQLRLDRAIRRGRQEYSDLGFRIMMRGYRAYASSWDLPLKFLF